MAKIDLIDRTALVAELEGLKAILGDVFLGMVVERAIERVKAQPEVEPVVQWIPVGRRLPELGKTVLVHGLRGGVYTAYLDRAGAYPRWHKLNSKSHYCEPTHWMPLPGGPRCLES